MSVDELRVVVRLAQHRPVPDLLGDLVEVVASCPAWAGTWTAMTVHDGAPLLQRQDCHLPGPLSGADVRAAAVRHGTPTARLSVGTGLRGWRYLHPPPPEKGVHALRLVADGPAVDGADEREDGTCSLTFTSAMPFHGGGDEPPAVVDATAANRDLVLGLLERVVEVLQPLSMRLHTDGGPPWPFNAFLVYYRDAAAVLADIAWVTELWGTGTARSGPSREAPPVRVRRLTHDLRTASEAVDLKERLARLAAASPAVGTEQVHGTLEAGSCRTRALGPGFVVHGDGLGLLPGFVDRFYTEPAGLVR